MNTPTLPTIAATVQSTRSIATFSRLLALAGLREMLEGAGPYTLFAPTDLAFRELPPGGLASLEEDPARLLATLEYHILGVDRRLSEIRNGKLATLEGTLLTSLVTDDGLRVDHAKVSGEPMLCANGVIHEIGAVLFPGFTPELSAAAQRQTELSPWSGRRRVSRQPAPRPTTAAQEADAMFQLPVRAPQDPSAS